MTIKKHYREYVSDSKLIESYSAYQDKYRGEPRESDKVSIGILRDIFGTGEGRSLLDVGCSTANFLRHLRAQMPAIRLTGSDLASSAIEKCKADPSLNGIDFVVADLLDLSALGAFDAITANAVAVYFDWSDYSTALEGVCKALKPGGVYTAFEWLHPFSVQDLTIIETNEWNPDGLTIRFRPMKRVEAALKSAGFESVQFQPFVLPIDLPFPGYDADVVTYTRKDDEGRRMAFRGALYQPWTHFIARKA